MLGRRSSSTSVAVAAVAAPFGRDVSACLERIERFVSTARARGAALVVFPECALGGYPSPAAGPEAPREAPARLSLHGAEIDRLVGLAGPTVLCVGFTEEALGGPYSSAVCLSGDGVLGVQRKVHVPPAEKSSYRPGEDFAAFDTPVGRMGIVLCYDKLFPEAARALALDGAQIVAAPAAWPVCRRDPARLVARDVQTLQFDLVDRCRAAENQLAWVAANQTGRFGSVRFLGRAKVVDPRGRLLALARSGLAVARIDPREAARDARARLCHLDLRVPAAYGRADHHLAAP